MSAAGHVVGANTVTTPCLRNVSLMKLKPGARWALPPQLQILFKPVFTAVMRREAHAFCWLPPGTQVGKHRVVHGAFAYQVRCARAWRGAVGSLVAACCCAFCCLLPFLKPPVPPTHQPTNHPAPSAAGQLSEFGRPVLGEVMVYELQVGTTALLCYKNVSLPFATALLCYRPTRWCTRCSRRPTGGRRWPSRLR
jgi:hypothetical protein